MKGKYQRTNQRNRLKRQPKHYKTQTTILNFEKANSIPCHSIRKANLPLHHSSNQIRCRFKVIYIDFRSLFLKGMKRSIGIRLNNLEADVKSMKNSNIEQNLKTVKKSINSFDIRLSNLEARMKIIEIRFDRQNQISETIFKYLQRKLHTRFKCHQRKPDNRLENWKKSKENSRREIDDILLINYNSIGNHLKTTIQSREFACFWP